MDRNGLSSLELPWTGERLVTSVQGDVALEHLHRYALARSLAHGKDVLDIASGEGYGSDLLARVARRVVGVDISPDSVCHAIRKYPRDNLHFRVGSCTSMPIESASVDLVVSFETLEHVEEHETMLAEVKRVLRPGGTLIVSTPNKTNYSDIPKYHNPFHLKELGQAEFVDLIRRHFQHADLLGQRVCQGSMLVPIASTPAPLETFRGNYSEIGVEPGLHFPIYLIAVASDDADSVHGHLSIFEGLGLLSDKDLWVADRDRRIQEREATIAHLERELIESHRRSADHTAQLVQRDQWVAEKDQQLVQKDQRLVEKDHQLAYKDLQLAQKDQQLLQKDHQLIQKDESLAERERALHQQNELINLKDHLVAQRDQRIAQMIAHLAQVEAGLAGVLSSNCWRITAPIRGATKLVQGARRRSIRLAKGSAGLAKQGVRKVLFGRRTKRAIGGLRTWTVNLIDHARFSIRGDAKDLCAAFPAPEVVTVSVIIPVFNHHRETLECLRSLHAQTSGRGMEVIVVDDCSRDLTPRMLRRVAGVRVVRNERNQGFIASCNRGAEQARGEYLVFLNNDTTVTPGWLDALLATFAARPDAGLVGAKLVYPDGRLQEAGGVIWSDANGWNVGRYDDPEKPEYNYVREVDYCSGACVMVPRDLFQRLGGFDVRFAPAYYEDADLAFRVRAAGKKVLYQPFSRVVHHEGLSSGTDVSQGVKKHQEINRTKFLEKWAPTLATHRPPGSSGDLARERGVGRRFLIIDKAVPTPDRDAGSLRMANLIAILQDLDFKVTFVPDDLARLGPYGETLQGQGVELVYAPHVASVEEHLRRHGPSYDFILISRFNVGEKHIDDARRHAPDAVILFDTVDLHFLRERRGAEVKADLEMLRRSREIKERELSVARKADFTIVVSEIEQAQLREEAEPLDVHVIPTIHAVHGSARPFAERENIAFIGGFEHQPNIDAVIYFVESIFPLVRERIPGVKFQIIGSHPPALVAGLAAADVIVTGHVPDIAPYFNHCRVAVAPLRFGAGVKGKLNTSMSYGVPAVVTPMAAEGMYLRDGENVLIADSPDAFADAVARLYRDEALWDKLSRNGLKNIEAHFSFGAARRTLRRFLDGPGAAHRQRRRQAS